MKSKSKKVLHLPEQLKLSYSSIKKFFECPRCFWFAVRGHKRPAETMPGILGKRDLKVKKYYDHWRKNGLPPLLKGKVPGILVDQKTADRLRKGIQYLDKKLNAVLWGKLDDCLYDPKRKVYIPIDNKSRGAFAKDVHPMDQFQLDVYTFLLEENSMSTESKAILGEFTDSDSFQLHEISAWKFKGIVLETNPARAKKVFEEAVRSAASHEKPEPSEACKFCDFMKKTKGEIRAHTREYLENEQSKKSRKAR